jgi:hypothetical protein
MQEYTNPATFLTNRPTNSLCGIHPWAPKDDVGEGICLHRVQVQDPPNHKITDQNSTFRFLTGVQK